MLHGEGRHGYDPQAEGPCGCVDALVVQYPA
jgi:hypothetical protein